MTEQSDKTTAPPAPVQVIDDETDREILRILQADNTLSMDKLAQRVGLSKTAVWNRVQRLIQSGAIRRQVAILNPDALGLEETVFVAVKTSQHSADWLDKFTAAIRSHPEILEAHRLAGDIDYLLKVKVRSTRHFDAFYKRLVSEIDLFNVTSMISMEEIKSTTALPI